MEASTEIKPELAPEHRVEISIVSPVYGCADCLQRLYERLVASLEPITQDFEIILVNDHSPDGAWGKIQEIGHLDPRVKGINLSRNFGQHNAITAGLDYADGDWVVVMDCDLQDQPEEIAKLYQKAQDGYDVVLGRRAVRKDSFFKRLGSSLFFRTLSYLTDQAIDSSSANFSICSRKVILEFRLMREQNRNFPLFVRWLGFNRVSIDIEHATRVDGQSSYTFRKLIYLAYDVIVAHSNKPLRLSISFGFLMALASFFYGLLLIIRHFLLEVPVQGWTSVMVSIYFVGGLLFANMGILGLYIGKIFNEGKGRAIYVIDECINLPRDR